MKVLIEIIIKLIPLFYLFKKNFFLFLTLVFVFGKVQVKQINKQLMNNIKAAIILYKKMLKIKTDIINPKINWNKYSASMLRFKKYINIPAIILYININEDIIVEYDINFILSEYKSFIEIFIKMKYMNLVKA